MTQVKQFWQVFGLVYFYSILLSSCADGGSNLKSKIKNRDFKLVSLYRRGNLEIKGGLQSLIKHELASKLKTKLKLYKGPIKEPQWATLIFDDLKLVTLAIFIKHSRVGVSDMDLVWKLKKARTLEIAYQLLKENKFWSDNSFYCLLSDGANKEVYLLEMDSLIYLIKFEMMFQAFIDRYPNGHKSNYKDLVEIINNLIENEIKNAVLPVR